MKPLNSVSGKIEAAIRKLRAEGKLLAPLPEKLVFPEPDEKILSRLRAHPKSMAALDVLERVLSPEFAPLLLTLFRQNKFEIKVSQKERSLHTFQEYALTCSGPVMRLYKLSEKVHKPKKNQLPEQEIPVSLEELIIEADSAIDFQARVYYFAEQATTKILDVKSRQKISL